MRVKSFTALTDSGLDKKVNKFLAQLAEQELEVVDLKYAASINGMSVLVLYKRGQTPAEL